MLSGGFVLRLMVGTTAFGVVPIPKLFRCLASQVVVGGWYVDCFVCPVKQTVVTILSHRDCIDCVLYRSRRHQ